MVRLCHKQNHSRCDGDCYEPEPNKHQNDRHERTAYTQERQYECCDKQKRTTNKPNADEFFLGHDLTNVDNFIRCCFSRGFDFDIFAELLAQQCHTNRRFVADFAVKWVSLYRTDNLKLL